MWSHRSRCSTSLTRRCGIRGSTPNPVLSSCPDDPMPPKHKPDHLALGAGLASLSFGNAVLLPVLVPLSTENSLPKSAAGLVLSLGALMVPLTAPWWGNRADRFGPRGVFGIGVGGGLLSFLLTGAAFALAHRGTITAGIALALLCLARILYGALASGSLPPEDPRRRNHCGPPPRSSGHR
ncbi:MFS transporter [Sagittula salina]|uniref:MFS transporter n=1 Tax=Sagittula salina TaxID=2820268 RepID=UPI003CC91F10